MSETSAIPARLASYFSPPVVRRVVEGGAIDDSVTADFDAAVLFIDISGFSTLAELLARVPAGAERLSRILNEYFSAIIGTVIEHGGVVMDFAGDAVIVSWSAEDNGDRLEEAARLAALCGIVLRDRLSDYEVDEGGAVSLTIGLGAGVLWSAMIVDSSQRSYFLFGGEEFDAASEAQGRVDPGEFAASSRAIEYLEGVVELEETATGAYRIGSARGAVDTVPTEPVEIDESTASTLATLLPPFVRAYAQADHGGWLAELRDVSVAFLRVRGPERGRGSLLDQIRKALRVSVTEVAAFGGVIVEMVVEGDGVVVVLAWGLRGSRHADDASRAVGAVYAVQTALGALHFDVDVGVATGRLFCGDRGSDVRREYALVGLTMNRAARLMQVAHGRALCDEETHAEAGGELALGVRFVEEKPISLKGFPEPVRTYRVEPEEEAAQEWSITGSAHTEPSVALFGRSFETERVRAALQSFRDGTGHESAAPILIQGEPGSGKTTLLNFTARSSRELGLGVARGIARSLDRRTPYGVWKPVFGEVFHDLPAEGVDVWVHDLFSQLNLTDQLDLASLLNPVLGIQLPESDFTRQLEGEGRAEVRHRLYVQLLERSATGAGRVILLDETEKFDSGSWAFLAQLVESAHRHLVVLAGQSMGEDDSAVSALVTDAAQEILLESLGVQATKELITAELGSTSVEPRLLQFIMDRASGNPLFIKEVCSALQHEEEIVVLSGGATLRSAEGQAVAELPRRIEGVIMRRIDRLEPNDQLLLKVASVVQRPFKADLLADVHPLGEDQSTVDKTLAYMEESGFLTRQAFEGETAFDFANSVIRDVAYGSLLFEQRKTLHGEVGEWFERQHRERLAPIYPVLAYHFVEAEMRLKAMAYSDLAGQQALSGFANKEALSLFRKARDMDDGLDAWSDHDDLVSADRNERAALRSYGLAEGLFRLGDMGASISEAKVGLDYLQVGVRKPQVGLPLSLASLLMRHPARARGWTLIRSEVKDLERHVLAYRMFDRMARATYMNLDKLGSVYATLQCLATAEKIGASDQLLRAYATMSGALGMLPWHGGARYFGDLAEQTLEVLGEDVGAMAEASGLQMLAVYSSGVAAWTRAEQQLARASDIFETLGELTEVSLILQMRMRNAQAVGRFSELRRISDEFRQTGRAKEVLHEVSWSLEAEIYARLVAGLEDHAVLVLSEQNAEFVKENLTLPGSLATAAALLTAARLRVGDHSGALESAREGLDVFESVDPSSFGMWPAYVIPVTNFAVLMRSEQLDGRDRTIAFDGFERTLSLLKRFARIYPTGRPRYLLFEGLRQWRAGKLSKARRSWDQALEAAAELDMDYEAALVHRQLHLVDPKENPKEGGSHRDMATRLLAGLGVSDAKVQRMFEDIACW